ncbi:MAG TPA: hypothetical protein VKS60_16305 [Stellaceae bacterium]|nr:hypothetical protein [Stellaceae bacterium]
MHHPTDETTDLRNLAGRIAAAGSLDPEELDSLVVLATRVAASLRESIALQRAALMHRVEAALAAFPELAGKSMIRTEAAGETGIGEIEQLAEASRTAAARLDSSKHALSSAMQADNYDEIVRIGSDAKMAQAALSAAEEGARQWVSRYAIEGLGDTVLQLREPATEAAPAMEEAAPEGSHSPFTVSALNLFGRKSTVN